MQKYTHPWFGQKGFQLMAVLLLIKYIVQVILTTNVLYRYKNQASKTTIKDKQNTVNQINDILGPK